MLDGGDFDLKDTPELLPVRISILSLKCKNSIKITGISHARYKETDKVANIATQLVKFGAEIKEDFDSIIYIDLKKLKTHQSIHLMITDFLWLFLLLHWH